MSACVLTKKLQKRTVGQKNRKEETAMQWPGEVPANSRQKNKTREVTGWERAAFSSSSVSISLSEY